jgi:hypothetical protein
MNKELKRILDRLERFEAINKEDVPILLKEVNDLYWSEKLAWQQFETIAEKLIDSLD